MISLLTMCQGTPPASSHTLPDTCVAVRKATLTEPVGEVPQDDADREERIRHHRACMEAAMQEYERHGCFHDRACADYHRIQFEREIAARSPEQVARMERELGLA